MENRGKTFSSRKFSIPELSYTPKGSPTKFSLQWDNKFSIENRDCPLLDIYSLDTRNIQKHRRIPLRNDSVLWDKTIWRKIVILASSLIAFFPYQNFFQIQKGSSTNFLRTLRQKFLTEKRGNVSLRPSFVSISFFDTIVFVEHRRVPLWNFSVLRENIFSMEDRDITFSSRKFSIPCFDDTLMGSPTKISATVRQQNFYRKPLYSLLRHKCFRYPKLSETQKFSSTNWFGTVRQNNLTENRDTGLLSYRIFFPYQNFFQIQKGSSTNFLRTLRQKFLTEKRGNVSLRPSFVFISFFDTIVFVEHRRVPLWNFSVLRENIFSMEDRDITFSSRKFSIPCFDDTLMGSPTKISATVRQQNFYRKPLYSLLRHKCFRYPKLSETQKFSSTNWFGTVRQNNLTENRDTGLVSYRFFFDTRIFFKYGRGPLRNLYALWDKNFWQKNVVMPPSVPRSFP